MIRVTSPNYTDLKMTLLAVRVYYRHVKTGKISVTHGDTFNLDGSYYDFGPNYKRGGRPIKKEHLELARMAMELYKELLKDRIMFT